MPLLGVGTSSFQYKGGTYNAEKIARFYSAMSKNIVEERKRIGGDWVVSHAVISRAFRDQFRTELGPDCIFVVLNMAKDEQIQRIKDRHGEGSYMNEFLIKAYDYYEAVGEDEPNAIEIWVTKDMSRDDVVEKILDMVAKYELK